MQRLSNQFDPLQGGGHDIAVGGEGCCTSSTCCCCIVTSIASSIASSRYMFRRAEQFNQTKPAAPVDSKLYGLYGFFFFLIGVAFAGISGAMFGSVGTQSWVVGAIAGLIVHFVIAVSLLTAIRVSAAAPFVMALGFSVAVVAEAAIWIMVVLK